MNKKNSIIIIIVSYVVVALLGLFVLYKAKFDSTKSFTVESSKDKSKDVIISFDRTKYWDNDRQTDHHTIGAQYDGVVTNNSNFDIVDWKFTIKLPAEIKIDSSWNGNFEIDGDKLLIVPDENTNIIPSGESKNCGLVLISTEHIKFTDITFEGKQNINIKQTIIYWIWIGLLIVVLTGTVFVCILYYKEKKFEYDKKKYNEIIIQAMNTFTNIIDAKDKYTRGHSKRVAYYSKLIAQRLGMNETEVDNIGYIALMHDCGKIGIPISILAKPAKLDDDEMKTMQSHTTIGGEMLKDFTAIDGIIDGALYHHERYDGNGYPSKKKGEDIPLVARIICVADSYDAMSSDRCYRKHLSKDVIVSELKMNSGKQFDPMLAQIMLDIMEEDIIEEELE